MSDSAVVFDAEGRVVMIVHPAGQTSLDDPAFNPKDHVQVRVARVAYDGCADELALLKATVDIIAERDAKIAAAVQSKIEAMEVERAALLEPVIP